MLLSKESWRVEHDLVTEQQDSILLHLPASCDFIIICLAYYHLSHQEASRLFIGFHSAMCLCSNPFFCCPQTWNCFHYLSCLFAYSFRSGPYTMFMDILYLVLPFYQPHYVPTSALLQLHSAFCTYFLYFCLCDFISSVLPESSLSPSANPNTLKS